MIMTCTYARNGNTESVLTLGPPFNAFLFYYWADTVSNKCRLHM